MLKDSVVFTELASTVQHSSHSSQCEGTTEKQRRLIIIMECIFQLSVIGRHIEEPCKCTCGIYIL